MTAATAERLRNRGVSAAMINPFTFPALGGALLAAAAIGVHLGESSIDLINPIYFQGPAVHPRDRGVALDERSLPSRPPAYGELYGWAEGGAARAADCGDCDALRARDAYAYREAYAYLAQVPYFGGRQEAAAVEAAEPVAVHSGVPEAAMAEPFVEAPEPVLRYAHYPVAAEEAAKEAVAAAAKDDPDYYSE